MKKTKDMISGHSFSFKLVYQRKLIALINVSEEECTLYNCLDDAVLNPLLKEFSDKKLNLKLRRDAGSWQIVSNREVLINGVGWRKKSLKDGDKIYLGEYRLVFEGSVKEDISSGPLPAVTKNRKKNVRFLESAAIVLSVFFLWYCTTISQDTDISHESEPLYTYSDDPGEIDSIPVLAEGDEVEAVSSSLSVYGPEDVPIPQKLDILFIHAHPDDESLDYGLYMAKAAGEGKATGLILFTDGDSGLDKYPDRPVDGFYSDNYLKGDELAKVRALEATNALSVLGARVYIRLGLWNRPYTAVEVSKDIDELLYEWGGEDFLVHKLVDLIEIFQPDIIVSPDGPGDAREHFEHEAVGVLADAAVSIYIQENPDQLKAYLKLVDVQQTDAYPGIPLIKFDSDVDKRYLEIKRTALMMHQTQADASYFGIKRLEKFPFEQYLIEYKSADLGELELAFLNNNMMQSLSGQTF